MTMSNKRVILTFSGRMRSGKGVLAKAMEAKYGAITFSMASHLKNLCVGILNIEAQDFSPWNIRKMDMWKNKNKLLSKENITLSDESIALISETTGFDILKVKEKSEGVSFNTVRDLLQNIGTNVIRAIDSDWHIKKTIQDISELPDDIMACVDDIRFKNELNAFREIGAITFFIIRGNAENVSNHESETSLSVLDFPNEKIVLNIGEENDFRNEFLAEFENRFCHNVRTNILLSDFSIYKNVNKKFASERNDLIDEIISQNKTNELFLKRGKITFKNNSIFEIKRVLDEMSINDTQLYTVDDGLYVIDNPIAYENLKRWL